MSACLCCDFHPVYTPKATQRIAQLLLQQLNPVFQYELMCRLFCVFKSFIAVISGVNTLENEMGKVTFVLPVPPCLVTYCKPIAVIITVLMKSCCTYISDCGIIAVLGGCMYGGSIDNGKLRKRDGKSNPLILRTTSTLFNTLLPASTCCFCYRMIYWFLTHKRPIHTILKNRYHAH